MLIWHSPSLSVSIVSTSDMSLFHRTLDHYYLEIYSPCSISLCYSTEQNLIVHVGTACPSIVEQVASYIFNVMLDRPFYNNTTPLARYETTEHVQTQTHTTIETLINT